MSTLCKIDRSGLGEKVLKLAKEGLSIRDIAARLEAEDSFKINRQSVSNYINENRVERAQTIKAAFDDAVADDIPDDVDELKHIALMLKSIYDDENVQPAVRINAADKARAIFESKFKFTGAAKDDGGVTVNVEGWRQELRARACRDVEKT
jgi:hypothetical protein